MDEWSLLHQLQEQTVFTPLDLYYAQRVQHYVGPLAEGISTLLAATMAAARHGHLCLNPCDAGTLFLVENPWREILHHFLKLGFTSLEQDSEKIPFFLHQEGGRYYLPKNWALERNILKDLSRLSSRHVDPVVIQDFPLRKNLNEEQLYAVKIALQHRITLLTGGPGTGKTFTAAAIIQAFLCSTNIPSPKIFLTAPTARAADNLKKSLFAHGGETSSLHYAGTLHGLLKVKNVQNIPEIPWIHADLIIVDECSMVDAALFVALLASLSENSNLVLMGDPHQLHPVGIGSLFFDLTHAELPFTLGRAHLKNCLRVEDRPLLELATALQESQSCTWPLIHSSLESKDREDVYDKLWELSMVFWPQPAVQLPDHALLLESLNRFRILSVLRQGFFGTEAINAMLIKRLSMRAKQKDFLAAPIQITRNDISTGLRNGEVGILLQPGNSAKGYALFPSRDHPLPIEVLPPYEYAFCCSVHKSQGSEYDEVILIVPPGSETFGREMLYTAVTRAKKKLHVVSTPEILHTMQKHNMRKSSGLL